jgi:DnaJ-class molecular chaperone with C-terminal Zn finger domain
MMRNVFTMLKTAECSWNEERESEKPSRYLAGLLDYHYVSGELSSAYHTLGLVPGATPEQVRAAHRKLAAKFHPDSSAADSGSFMRVQSAYELILRQL